LAFSLVLIVLATRYGLEGVWLAGLLSGMMILVLGVLRLGWIVSLIPAMVISGFTRGIVEEITAERVFWSADRAILSLGAQLSPVGQISTEEEKPGLDTGQTITPYEERKNHRI
jgi:hypothetical protein